MKRAEVFVLAGEEKAGSGVVIKNSTTQDLRVELHDITPEELEKERGSRRKVAIERAIGHLEGGKVDEALMALKDAK